MTEAIITEGFATIKIETPLGTLCATTAGDPDYPGIYIYLKRKDGSEVDIALTEVNSIDAPDFLHAYIYGDTQCEDWTDRFSFTKNELYVQREEYKEGDLIVKRR